MNSPLRVHHFGPDPAYVGGMATVMVLFSQRRLGAERVTVHATWVPDDQLRSARMTAAALRVVHGLDRDEVVHVHISTRGSFVRKGVILAYARRRGLPTVLSLHGADFADFADRYPGLSGRVLRRACVITALAEESEVAARKLAPDALIRQVPNPVEIDDGGAPVTATAQVVLFAGEIGRRKGADVLARAWPIVQEALPAARCVVIGPGGDVELRGGDGLTVLPEGSLHAIRQLLREARVAVLPSRAEGMPMFLLEAMAAARPFVSTPVGAIPQLAEAGGLLVPVGESEPLAAALVALLCDPALAQRLGTSGQAMCRATRSPEIVSEIYRELYRDAQRGARGTR